MAHIHSVYDTDKHFIIDPVTRTIKNAGDKIAVVEGDHNSERFTFEIPRYIEGHDMLTCNKVEVHYNNVGAASPSEKHPNVYDVDDLDVSPADENVVIFSWLISKGATRYSGKLEFHVKFMCDDGDGKPDYVWKTFPHSGVTVLPAPDSAETIDAECEDMLKTIEERITENVTAGVDDTVNEAVDKAVDVECKRVDELVADCEEATNTLVLTHKQFVEGGYVEALKEMNNGDKLLFWIGTTEEYEQDKDSLPANTLCLTTDGVIQYLGHFDTEEALENALTDLLETMALASPKRFRLSVQEWGEEVTSRTSMWDCDVIRTSENYAMFRARSLFTGENITSCQKMFADGSWLPVEWVNPPMVDGYSYRTTERNNGKPVYVAYVSITLPIDSSTVNYPFALLNDGESFSIVEISGCVSYLDDMRKLYNPLSDILFYFEKYDTENAISLVIPAIGNEGTITDGRAHITVKYTK